MDPKPKNESGAEATRPEDRETGLDEGEELIEDELLVEEISIDGMCGVY